MPTWRRTAALQRAVLGTALLVLGAVLTRRADLAALAVPLALGTVWSLLGWRGGEFTARVRARPPAVLEGDETVATVTVSGTAPVSVVSTTLGYGPGLSVDNLPRNRAVRYARATTLAAGEEVEQLFVLRAVRWGRASVGPVVVAATAADGLLAREPLVERSFPVHVWPLRDSFQATDAVPDAAGMVGPHRSRLVGDGTDIAEVRPFQPGDRLRRINWRVSLRHPDLHVTSTVSDRDTDVVLLLDTRYEIWPRGGGPGEAESNLDATVRAAAAIGEHYLRTGDRVGLLDLGQPLRRVRPGAGRAHLVRLLEVLLDVRGRRRVDETSAALALADLPPGALVVVLSPLVGEAVFGPLATLARSGHAVVAVDTLPPDAGPAEYGAWTALAWRVWWIERTNALGRLAELGVPVVGWQGTGSLDQVLRDVSRAARAPRLRR